MTEIEAMERAALLPAEVMPATEAAEVTSRIRVWANSCPLEDIKRAFFGRIWLAMGYDSWSEWCDCELNGFKLPVIERREVVAELSESGMSNPAIADVIGVDQSTVYRDKEAGGFADAKPVTGKDGKTYHREDGQYEQSPEKLACYLGAQRSS